MVVGLAGTRSLILASGAFDCLAGDHECYGHDVGGLFRHSAAVGAAARALGRVAGLSPRKREVLFVAGLVHDVGKTVLAPWLAAREVAVQAPLAVEDEQRLFGCGHAEASALACKAWCLERAVCELADRHHHDGQFGADGLTPGLAMLRIADALAHEHGVGYARGRAPQGDLPLADRDAARLGGERWPRAREAAAAAIEAAVTSFAALGAARPH